MRDMKERRETSQEHRQEWLSRARSREDDRLDPNVYERGINGLTVAEALQRAFPRVMRILERSGERYSEFERELVRRAIRSCLIAQVSRANLYRIAGILVADRRDEGINRQTSLALAYVAALREAFLYALSVGDAVETPFGVGEVRYLSDDGRSAVVRLEDVAADRELWLPTGQLSLLKHRPGDPTEPHPAGPDLGPELAAG